MSKHTEMCSRRHYCICSSDPVANRISREALQGNVELLTQGHHHADGFGCIQIVSWLKTCHLKDQLYYYVSKTS